MVPTSVLLASVLSSYALVAGAFYMLNAQVGHRISDVTDGLNQFRHDVSDRFERLEKSVDKRFDRIDDRFDRVDDRFDRVDDRFDRVDDRFDRVDDRFDRLRAAVAGIDARLSTLEDRG